MDTFVRKLALKGKTGVGRLAYTFFYVSGKILTDWKAGKAIAILKCESTTSCKHLPFGPMAKLLVLFRLSQWRRVQPGSGTDHLRSWLSKARQQLGCQSYLPVWQLLVKSITFQAVICYKSCPLLTLISEMCPHRKGSASLCKRSSTWANMVPDSLGAPRFL